jgi:hypothetical protein
MRSLKGVENNWAGQSNVGLGGDIMDPLDSWITSVLRSQLYDPFLREEAFIQSSRERSLSTTEEEESSSSTSPRVASDVVVKLRRELPFDKLLTMVLNRPPKRALPKPPGASRDTTASEEDKARLSKVDVL